MKSFVFFAFAALGAAALGAACANGVSNESFGSGGSGGDFTVSSSIGTGGSGGDDGGIDAPPDGPVACTVAADCAAFNGPCTLGTCINGMCSTEPANDFGACDDGQFCTENDTCQGGQCLGGSMKFCSSADTCHVGMCDEASKSCSTAPGNDGAQCDDMDPCTSSGVCQSGTCSKGPPLDCSFYDGPCNLGVCDPVIGCKAIPSNENGVCDDGMFSPCSGGTCKVGKCVSGPTNEGGACDDGLFCTVNDHCQVGKCISGGPNPCAPPGGCYIASCDENLDQCTAVPGNNGAPCDDFNICTINTKCSNGACINGAAANEGLPCDDGSACTSNTICLSGACAGGVGPTVYFADDFHDASKGWTLGTEWQIGPAKASMNGVYGADPDTDHSATMDNGVAGVVIGGNESPVTHPAYWIESPPFNTSAAVGPVVLGFYRWINSDYDPFMHNMVEVWNGSSWVNLWTTGGPPGLQDSPPSGTGWTYMQFDITAYKNAGMRVRMGYDITSDGVFTVGSWNLDDVLVASAACP